MTNESSGIGHLIDTCQRIEGTLASLYTYFEELHRRGGRCGISGIIASRGVGGHVGSEATSHGRGGRKSLCRPAVPGIISCLGANDPQTSPRVGGGVLCS